MGWGAGIREETAANLSRPLVQAEFLDVVEQDGWRGGLKQGSGGGGGGGGCTAGGDLVT